MQSAHPLSLDIVTGKDKGKGNVHPLTGHEDLEVK